MILDAVAVGHEKHDVTSEGVRDIWFDRNVAVAVDGDEKESFGRVFILRPVVYILSLFHHPFRKRLDGDEPSHERQKGQFMMHDEVPKQIIRFCSFEQPFNSHPNHCTNDGELLNDSQLA